MDALTLRRPLGLDSEALLGVLIAVLSAVLLVPALQYVEDDVRGPHSAVHARTAAPAEIVALRTRDTEHFRLPDGSMRVVVDRGMHFRSAEGAWERVDLDYRRTPDGFIADRSEVTRAVVGRRLMLTTRSNGHSITWRFDSPVTVDGSTATATEDGTVWTYRNTREGIKASTRVTKVRGRRTYAFPYALSAGTSLTEARNGDLVSTDFAIPRAFVVGADGTRHDASPWKLADGTATFAFDDTNLPSSAFPYVIDPTTAERTPSTVSGDGYAYVNSLSYQPTAVELASGTYNDTGDIDYIENGIQSGSYRHRLAFTQWEADALAIPATAYVTSARVKVYAASSVRNSNGKSLYVDWYYHGPTIDPTDVSVDPLGTAYRTSLSSLPGSGSRVTFNLLNPEGHIGPAGEPVFGLRWAVTGPPGCSSTCSNGWDFLGRAHGAFGSAGQAPVLEVDYTDSSPTTQQLEDSANLEDLPPTLALARIPDPAEVTDPVDAASQPAPSVCTGRSEYVHQSDHVRGNVDAESQTECQSSVPYIKVRNQLWEARWWGWDRVGTPGYNDSGNRSWARATAYWGCRVNHFRVTADHEVLDFDGKRYYASTGNTSINRYQEVGGRFDCYFDSN